MEWAHYQISSSFIIEQIGTFTDIKLHKFP